MEFEEKLKMIRLDSGLTVYQHLMNIIGKVVLDKVEDPFIEFERLSSEMRNRGNIANLVSDMDGLMRQSADENTNKSLCLRNFFNIQPLVTHNTKTEDGEAEEQPTEIEAEPVKEPDTPLSPPFVLTDITRQESLANKLGIGLGHETVKILQRAIQKFSSKREGIKVKFWGKVIGTKSDYYVIEADKQPSEEEAGESVEAGLANKTHYVSTDIMSDSWVELPLVSPRQIRQAKKIRQLMSGDINRRVVSAPSFDGQESHLVI